MRNWTVAAVSAKRLVSAVSILRLIGSTCQRIWRIPIVPAQGVAQSLQTQHPLVWSPQLVLIDDVDAPQPETILGGVAGIRLSAFSSLRTTLS